MRKYLTGDSLIEVLIAFAIFSAVGVSSIGTIRASLSRAQSTIEDTNAQLTIESQAEALRFVQEAHLANGSNEFYNEIINKIANLANPAIKEGSSTSTADLVQTDYPSHHAPYNNSDETDIHNLNAFVINPNLIGTESYYNSLSSKEDRDAYINKVVVSINDSPDTFVPASTFPRLYYEDSTGYLIRAEGIWVIGISQASQDSETGDFIDFYVRTCWDALGSSTPDKVSTTIRLATSTSINSSDPISHASNAIIFHYKDKDGQIVSYSRPLDGFKREDVMDINLKGSFPQVNYDKETQVFAGWAIGSDKIDEISNWENIRDDHSCDDPSTTRFCDKTSVHIDLKDTTWNESRTIHLYAIIRPKVAVQFHYKNSSGNIISSGLFYSEVVPTPNTTETINLNDFGSNFPSAGSSGPAYYNPNTHAFPGWAIGDSNTNNIDNWQKVSTFTDYHCKENTASCPSTINVSFGGNDFSEAITVHLYAIVKPKVYIQLVADTSGSMGDEINSVSSIFSTLFSEAARNGGIVDAYTLGDSGFGQFSVPDCNNVNKTVYFSSSSGSAADFSRKFSSIVSSITGNYSDAPEYCGAWFMNYLLNSNPHPNHKRIIIYLTDTYGASYQFVNGGNDYTAWNSSNGSIRANGVSYSTLNSTAKNAKANIYVVTRKSNYGANLVSLWSTATSGTGNTYVYSRALDGQTGILNYSTISFTQDGALYLK